MKHGSVINIHPKQKSNFGSVHTHLLHSGHGSLPWILTPPDSLVLVNIRQVFLAPVLIELKEHFADKRVAGVFQNPRKHSWAIFEKVSFIQDHKPGQHSKEQNFGLYRAFQ